MLQGRARGQNLEHLNFFFLIWNYSYLNNRYANFTNVTEVGTNRRTDENYIPLGINAGGVNISHANMPY